MKPGLKNFLSNMLEIHTVAISPREAANTMNKLKLTRRVKEYKLINQKKID